MTQVDWKCQKEPRGRKDSSASVDAGVNQDPLKEVSAEVGVCPLERSCYCTVVKTSS